MKTCPRPITFILGVSLLFTMPGFAETESDQGEVMASQPIQQSRNPFWPISYTPAVKVAAPSTEGSDNKSVIDLGLPEGVFSQEEIRWFQGKLAPSGIFAQGSKRFAIIQGELLGEGDLTRIEHKGRKLKFRVKRIATKSIVLRYEDPKSSPKRKLPALRPGPLPLTEPR